jgi:hypothetical protein
VSRYYNPDTSVPPNLLGPRSSSSVSFTAFAQLGALRLNAKRCIISLFDRSSQYIIAEATQTLSLQSDRVHKHGDGLWLGTCMIPEDNGICGLVVNPTSLVDLNLNPDEDDGASCVIPDLLLDERFQHSPFVTCAPFNRFYAGVPIRSKEGTAIGSYCILDNLPRDGLDAESLQFMKDVAATVMTHLELTRAREHSHQSERMARGLGAFIEGGQWFYRSRSRREEGEKSRENRAKRQAAEVAQTDEQIPRSADPIGLGKPKPDITGPTRQLSEPSIDSPSSSSKSIAEHLSTDHSTPEAAIPQFSIRHNLDSLDEASSQTPPSPPTSKSDSFSSHSSKSEHQSKNRDLLNESLRTNVQSIFGRAAHIIRDSADVDGVIFFDASVASFGGLVQLLNSRDQSDNSSDSMPTLSSGDDDRRPAIQSEHGSGSSRQQRQGRMSEVLGLSISKDAAGANANADSEEHSIPASLLMAIIEKYKRGGYLWNFDIDGSSYSGLPREEPSTAAPDSENTKAPYVTSGRKAARKLAARAEAESVIRIFPGARCVAVMPLWDSHRERWFAGAFIWTKSPNRILTAERELSYFAAFGNSIMAEIAQLDSMMADKAKSDLLGSISHELRSPLHGILGGIEILEDSVMTPSQVEVLHTVETCSRTLLDTVEHVSNG